MAVIEPERLKMHEGFIETMGEEQAARLMAHLPTTGWADVATKEDLDGLRTATKQDIEALRKDVEHLREATQKDIAGLRELTTERFKTVATKQDIAELKAHMDETLRKHAYSLIGFTIGLVSGGAGLIALGAALF